jgi:hypothetical protein
VKGETLKANKAAGVKPRKFATRQQAGLKEKEKQDEEATLHNDRRIGRDVGNGRGRSRADWELRSTHR